MDIRGYFDIGDKILRTPESGFYEPPLGYFYEIGEILKDDKTNPYMVRYLYIRFTSIDKGTFEHIISEDTLMSAYQLILDEVYDHYKPLILEHYNKVVGG